MYTKPDEWDELSPVFKKGGLIKCWRVTPFETVPKTGKRCFRWLSDRFNPDGDEPVDNVPEPDGDPHGAMMLKTKIKRAIEEYHREGAKK